MCPARTPVKPVIEDPLAQWKGSRKIVYGFDIGGGVLPPEPPRLDSGIHMCGGHLLKFLDSHVRHMKGKKMTVNMQRREVPCKKQDLKLKEDKKNECKEMKQRARHLKKEIIVVLVGNEDVLFEVPSLNVLD